MSNIHVINIMILSNLMHDQKKKKPPADLEATAERTK